MKTIRCIALDDEPLALTVLSEYISKISYVEMLETYTDAGEASAFIQMEKPDLLFLDIQMPEILGIDFIKTLTYKPAIILTTAYPQYALEGFNLDVVDYLLKPIPFERFLQAVNKAVRILNPDKPAGKSDEKSFLFVKSGHKSIKVNFEDILYLEGMKEYVAIHTQEKRFMKLGSMKSFESILPGNEFLRVHKSYIVNLDHVKSYYGNVLEIKDEKIPVGRAYKEALNKIMQ